MVWGRIDRETGQMDVIRDGGADPDGEAVDLLDELAELTIQYGGRALEVPTERLPVDSGVAAVLR